MYGYATSAESLVNAGVDIHAVDDAGDTALHLAAQKPRSVDKDVVGGGVQIIHKLVSLGANVNTRNKQGQTPMDMAVESGYPDIVQALRDYVQSPTSAPGQTGPAEGTTPPVTGKTLSKVLRDYVQSPPSAPGQTGPAVTPPVTGMTCFSLSLFPELQTN